MATAEQFTPADVERLVTAIEAAARRKGWDACREQLAAVYRHEALLGPDGRPERVTWGRAAEMAEHAEPAAGEVSDG